MLFLIVVLNPLDFWQRIARSALLRIFSICRLDSQITFILSPLSASRNLFNNNNRRQWRFISEKISRDSIRSAAPDAEGPAAPAAEPEPSSQKTKSQTPDLEAVDLQRLLTDARYQLDIMDIYGQKQTQRLLDQARSK